MESCPNPQLFRRSAAGFAVAGSAFQLLIVTLVTGATRQADDDVGVESFASSGGTIARIHAWKP